MGNPLPPPNMNTWLAVRSFVCALSLSVFLFPRPLNPAICRMALVSDGFIHGQEVSP